MDREVRISGGAALTADGVGFVENLGPAVNTAGSEMFPTVAPDGSLYFSSDGHPGMGGLDIFRAVSDSLTGQWKVENLRTPVNSAADDFGMTFEPGHPNRGFFSSNRGDARGWDHLYSFEYPETHHVLTGLVYDRQGGPLAGATVTLAGNDGTYLRIDNPPRRHFQARGCSRSQLRSVGGLPRLSEWLPGTGNR